MYIIVVFFNIIGNTRFKSQAFCDWTRVQVPSGNPFSSTPRGGQITGPKSCTSKAVSNRRHSHTRSIERLKYPSNKKIGVGFRNKRILYLQAKFSFCACATAKQITGWSHGQCKVTSYQNKQIKKTPIYFKCSIQFQKKKMF